MSGFGNCPGIKPYEKSAQITQPAMSMVFIRKVRTAMHLSREAASQIRTFAGHGTGTGPRENSDHQSEWGGDDE